MEQAEGKVCVIRIRKEKFMEDMNMSAYEKGILNISNKLWKLVEEDRKLIKELREELHAGRLAMEDLAELQEAEARLFNDVLIASKWDVLRAGE